MIWKVESAIGMPELVTLAEWPLLSGDFQLGLQGRSVHSKLHWRGLNVAMFALGVRDVTCSLRCICSEADGAACENSGERLRSLAAGKSAPETWSKCGHRPR